MEQSQMTVAATSKRDSWVNRAWYVQPETANRLKSYVNRQQENGINIDASDVVNEALAAFLSNNAATPSEPASELADLVDLVVSLKNDIEELQKWRKSQVATEEQWVEDLRLKIKRAHGRGWVIRAMAKTKLNPDGRCQLTRIAENRKRTSVILPLSWIESESKAIFEIVDHICTMHKQKGLSLQDALKSYW
jgi:hypothetical protein